jgi:hypothetical protein
MLFQVIFQVIQGHYTLCYYKLFYSKYNNLNTLKYNNYQ